MIPMFLCLCTEKKKTNKRADPCAFKAFQQLQKLQMESSAHKKCVRYTLYMLTFVSLVVFWRYFLSKIVWLIKNLFYRFLNLSLAIFLTYYLIFLCILSFIFLKRMFLKIKKTCKRAAKLLLQYQVANLVEKYAIPHSMIMNFDQTPSTFAPVSSRALDIRGTSHVDIF